MESTRMQTARAFLKAFSEHSYPAILPFLDESYTFQILPMSVKSPICNRHELQAPVEEAFLAFTSPVMVTKALFEDADRNAVVAYYDMAWESTGVGLWETDGVSMLTFSEDGKRVVEQRDFIDSAKALELKELLRNP